MRVKAWQFEKTNLFSQWSRSYIVLTLKKTKTRIFHVLLYFIQPVKYILSTFFLIFQLLQGGEIVQPILIAAGGGGSSSFEATGAASTASTGSHSGSPDARGLINPWETLNNWQNLVATQDTDAGKYQAGLFYFLE